MKNGAEFQQSTPVSLHARGLGKSYGFRRVLSDVDLDVQSGEVLAICGANGSGKSTLLRMLGGLLRPSIGQTWVIESGSELTQEARWGLVSVAAPATEPYLHLTLAENILFMGKARGGVQNVEEARELSALVGLEIRRNDLVGSFSSGMVQRTRLAMSLAVRPKVLLLDEPSHCLDDLGRQVVADIVESQRKAGLCVIATNDAYDAQLADSIYSLDGQQR